MSLPEEQLARLRRTLKSADAGGSVSREEIEKSFDVFVDDARAAGWPPERLLIAIKLLLAESTRAQPREKILRRYEKQKRFSQEVISHCIERYYGSAKERAT